MNEVKIDYKPPEIYMLRMLATLAWILMFFLGMLILRNNYKLMMIYGFGVCVPLMLFVMIFVGMKKTVVRYDENRICWKWLWLSYDVDMSKVKSFSHSIRWTPARNGREYWCEIRFRTGHGEKSVNYACLSTFAGAGSHRAITNLSFHDEEIMEIYDFYAGLYPEKAKGEVKYDKHCV